jgi:hypothetical protein
MAHLQDMCFDGERLEPGPRHARGDPGVRGDAATSKGHNPADSKPEEILLEHRDFQVRLASTRGRRIKSSSSLIACTPGADTRGSSGTRQLLT